MAFLTLRQFKLMMARTQQGALVLLVAGAAWIFRDTVVFLFREWQRPEYSYGWFLPLVSAYLVWQRWPQMRHRSRASGLAVLLGAAGLCALLYSRVTGPVVAAWGLWCVAGAIVLMRAGRSAMRSLAAPLALSALAIPLPEWLYQSLTTTLAQLSGLLAASTMRAFGTPVLLHGGMLDLGTVQFVVAGTVSGLNSLLPLLVIAVIATFFLHARWWVRAVLVMSTLPVALLMNSLHMAVNGVVADHYGIARMNGLVSLFDGWILFMTGAGILLIETWALLRLSGEPRPLLETLDFDLVQHRPAPRTAGADGSRGRVLLIASNFAPELTGIGKYMGDMAAWLSQSGFEIRVVTAPPYYPAWRVLSGYSSRRYMTQYLGGIRVIRCPLLVPRRPGGLNRLVHLLSFAASTFPVVLWQSLVWRPRMVFVVEPPLGCAPAALLGARLSGARAWLHVQDFEIDAAFQLGILKSAFIHKAALATERWLMRRFDGVSSISPRMLRKLLRKGVDRERIRYFPNWVDTTAIRPSPRVNALRLELGISPETRVLLYSGNMGEKQGLELLIDVARALEHRMEALILLCGEGAAKPRIIAAAEPLSNVRFMPLQPLARLNELLNLADVHLLPQREDAEDLVMPSKLTAILASGRPVVASARLGTDLARAAATGGVVVPPGNPAAFAAALCRLLDDAQLGRLLGASGRAYAITQWDRDIVLGKVGTELDAVLGDADASVTASSVRAETA